MQIKCIIRAIRKILIKLVWLVGLIAVIFYVFPYAKQPFCNNWQDKYINQSVKIISPTSGEEINYSHQVYWETNISGDDQVRFYLVGEGPKLFVNEPASFVYNLGQSTSVNTGQGVVDMSTWWAGDMGFRVMPGSYVLRMVFTSKVSDRPSNLGMMVPLDFWESKWLLLQDRFSCGGQSKTVEVPIVLKASK